MSESSDLENENALDSTSIDPSMEVESIPDPEIGEEPVRGEIVSEEEVTQIVRAIARRAYSNAMSWSAPLPLPEQLSEYRESDPELANAIRLDFAKRTELDERIVDHEIDAHNRELRMKEREQDLRERQSDSDVDIRKVIVWFAVLFIPFLVVVALVIVLFAPISGWEKTIISGLFLAPIPILGGIVLLRGRHSDAERDVLKELMPHLKALASKNEAKQPERELPG